MNLSFAGCGFLGIYHVGVASCLRRYAPNLLVDKISGASAGAIAACCLLCDSPLGEITSDILRVVKTARSKTLGPFSPSFNIQKILKDGLDEILPPNAHDIVSGRLHISMTRVHDKQNVIINQFKSKEELLQALLCSSFVPLFSGLVPPLLNGVRYVDGCFSDNLPLLDDNTITVSPFCGDSDICPYDNTQGLIQINLSNTSIELSRQNLYRFCRILFPPKPEILAKMCQQGFDDALRFLQRNCLISCTQCWAVQSTFHTHNEPNDCDDCRAQQEVAVDNSLPETVASLLQEAIDSANKGIVNWLFRHRGVKFLSILSVPYVLPLEIAYATFLKVLESVPELKRDLWVILVSCVTQILQIIDLVDRLCKRYSARYSYQMAITEYSELDFVSLGNDYNSHCLRYNLGFPLELKNLDMSDSQTHVLHLTAEAKDILANTHDHDRVDDTLEKILEVTNHHDALMAYYYLDENNEMNVTEIYDVTDTNTSQEPQTNF